MFRAVQYLEDELFTPLYTRSEWSTHVLKIQPNVSLFWTTIIDADQKIFQYLATISCSL